MDYKKRSLEIGLRETIEKRDYWQRCVGVCEDTLLNAKLEYKRLCERVIELQEELHAYGK